MFPAGRTGSSRYTGRDGSSVFSRSATAMRLLLYYDVKDREPVEIIPFDRDTDRWGDIWSVFVPGVRPGQLYHFQADGPFDPEDDLFRRALRSVSHCYSGCGAGEILGVSLAVGVLALPTAGVAAVTFTFAYVFGLALTVGPLVQDRVPFRTAMKDGVVSETASIVVMELVAIGVDLALARDAGMDEPLFWSSLAVSLTLGLIAATPVNAWLIARGVKAGMHDPREMAAHAA